MVWVRREFENEFAVLSTWLCALLPWSVGYFGQRGVDVVEIRFPFLAIRYAFGVDFGTFVRTPLGMYSRAAAAGTSGTLGYAGYVVAALVFLVVFLLSIALYLREERTAAYLVDPPRVFGALLVFSGLLFTGASYQLFANFPGVLIPIGVVFQLVFGGLLLRVSRRDAPATAAG
jgi:uncharacterized protein (TIGR04206 family)